MYNFIIPCSPSHAIVPKYCHVAASLSGGGLFFCMGWGGGYYWACPPPITIFAGASCCHKYLESPDRGGLNLF